MFNLCKIICCCIGLLLSNPSIAKEINSLQYDARLCSAQLLVIQGDVNRLQKPETRSLHKTGLKQRIAGTLGTLSWLCRQHSQLLNTPKFQNHIGILQSAFKTTDWQLFKQNLSSLITKMPLNVKHFDPQHLTKKNLDTSISIYKHYCQACHINPNNEVQTPAYSFFEMAKSMSRAEFLARMIVGVHGTPKIALRNPLTDKDISGLVTYFSKESK